MIVSLFGLANCLRLTKEWLIDFTADPEPMEQHRQLARDSDNGSFLRVFPTAFSQGQPPLPQSRVATEVAQRVMRTLH